MSDDSFETELIEQARRGEGTARDRLVEHMLDQVRAFVLLNAGEKIRRLESPSDLVQTICRQVLEDLPGYRGASEAQFRKWLFRLALRKIQMKARHHAAERRNADRAVPIPEAESLIQACSSIYSPTRQAAAHEQFARLQAAFGRLPEDHREILNLIFLMGMSHAEAGPEMGRSEDATRQLLRRARSRLALELARQG